MRLLVGLGNPGAKYEGNRHNVGFMAVDAIHDRHGFGPWKAKFQGHVADGAIGGQKLMALKPTTFMNESGRAVGEALRFYKLDPADVIVIYDELDLAPTRLKVKQGGGHGGHNGLRSIDAHIGKDYWRVRIGIGHPGDKARVSGHVLSDFSKGERPNFEALIEAMARRFDLMAAVNASDFMSKVSLDLRPAPLPKPDAKGAPKEKTGPADSSNTATPPKTKGAMADQLAGLKDKLLSGNKEG